MADITLINPTDETTTRFIYNRSDQVERIALDPGTPGAGRSPTATDP